jgi:hypothetical protein
MAPRKQRTLLAILKTFAWVTGWGWIAGQKAASALELCH